MAWCAGQAGVGIGARTRKWAGRVAVFKSSVEVHDVDGQPIGAGHAYVHLRLGPDTPQQATGTVSLRAWEPAGAPPAWLQLSDGRRLAIQVGRDVLSDCSRSRILRYEAAWPPTASAESRPCHPPSTHRSTDLSTET